MGSIKVYRFLDGRGMARIDVWNIIVANPPRHLRSSCKDMTTRANGNVITEDEVISKIRIISRACCIAILAFVAENGVAKYGEDLSSLWTT